MYQFALTCFSRGAFAVEASDPVDARRPVEAGGVGAIVDVDGTIRTGPAVHAYAGVAAHAVRASGPVLANGRTLGTLVHVLLAEPTHVRRRT